MLDQPIGVISAVANGSGSYSFSVFFANTVVAQYLQVGDYIEKPNGDLYEVTTWQGFPNDFASGGQVTANFVNNDVLPTNDAGFTSLAYTPAQESSETELQLGGTTNLASVFSGQNYEYELSVNWDDNVAATELVVGDVIVDNAGKAFVISFIDPVNRFSVPFRMRELDEVAEAPTSGRITAFRATSNFSFFQGIGLSAEAINRIRNRDSQIVDANLGTGTGGTGSLNGEYESYEISLSAANISAKQIVLDPAPLDPDEVVVFLIKGSVMDKDVHYTISGSTISWSGGPLDSLLQVGDAFRVSYFS